MSMEAPSKVIFFDGECGLCQGFVRWVLRRDREHKFLFAPLRGKTFYRLLGEQEIPVADSLVFWTPSGVRIRSAAVLEIMSELSGIWPTVAKLGGVVPQAIADVVYRVLAKLRRRMFGKTKELCSILSPEQRRQIIE